MQRLPVLDVPDLGEGGQQEVYQPVVVRHVQREDLHDRLCGQHLHWSYERVAHPRCEGHSMVFQRWRNFAIASTLFAPPLRSASLQHGQESLAEEQKPRELQEGVGDRRHPERPAPRRVRGDEAAGNRTQRGAQHRGNGVDRDALAPLLAVPQVREASASDGQRGAPANTGKQSESYRLPRALREAAADVEGQEEEVGELKDGETSKFLLQRCKYDGPHRIAQDED